MARALLIHDAMHTPRRLARLLFGHGSCAHAVFFAATPAGGVGACGGEAVTGGAPDASAAQDGTAGSAGQEAGGGQGGGGADEDGGGADVDASGKSGKLRVTGGPLSPGAACDPVGMWVVSWGAATESSGIFCHEPTATNIEVTIGDGGALYVEYGTTSAATVSDDGCHLTAESIRKETNPSEFWYVMSEIDLTIDGDGANGTYVASNSGFCLATKAGPASATREP